jgi:hypothetical protein
MNVSDVLEAVLNSAFFNMLITLGIGIGGWLAKEMWGLIRELRMKLAELERELGLAYVRKEDLKGIRSDIHEVLERIERKLDAKVDRDDCSRFHQSSINLDDRLRGLLELATTRNNQNSG